MKMSVIRTYLAGNIQIFTSTDIIFKASINFSTWKRISSTVNLLKEWKVSFISGVNIPIMKIIRQQYGKKYSKLLPKH